MQGVIILRIIALVFTGVILYAVLLYVSGQSAGLRLKRRRRAGAYIGDHAEVKLFIMFLLAITGIAILGFFIIRLYIRGVQ